jgi:hypothetical protein
VSLSKNFVCYSRLTLKSRPRIYSIAIDMRSWFSRLNDQIASLQITPRGLETHWKQAPVTLEDALGFLVPIPLELVNSWDVRIENFNYIT